MSREFSHCTFREVVARYTPAIGLLITSSLSGLILFRSLFHSVFILHSSDINFWASLQVGSLDFSLTRGSVFISLYVWGEEIIRKAFNASINNYDYDRNQTMDLNRNVFVIVSYTVHIVHNDMHHVFVKF